MMRKLALSLLALAAGTTGLVAMGGAAQADEYRSMPPSIEIFSVDHGRFYPTVRDGYRDGVHFLLSGDPVNSQDPNNDTYYAQQQLSVVVRNSAGATVAKHSEYRTVDDGWAVTAFWNWNGKNHAGTSVRAGTYTATARVTNTETGETDTATRTLTAKHGYVTTTHTKARDGYNTSSRVRRGDCVLSRNPWFEGPNSLYLDCRGGSVTANYGFSLPRNARNLTWHVTGRHGFGFDGHIYKTFSHGRVSARVAVKVNGWEAYGVKRVVIGYSTTAMR